MVFTTKTVNSILVSLSDFRFLKELLRKIYLHFDNNFYSKKKLWELKNQSKAGFLPPLTYLLFSLSLIKGKKITYLNLFSRVNVSTVKKKNFLVYLVLMQSLSRR
jgi:hypothetical protein